MFLVDVEDVEGLEGKEDGGQRVRLRFDVLNAEVHEVETEGRVAHDAKVVHGYGATLEVEVSEIGKQPGQGGGGEFVVETPVDLQAENLRHHREGEFLLNTADAVVPAGGGGDGEVDDVVFLEAKEEVGTGEQILFVCHVDLEAVALRGEKEAVKDLLAGDDGGSDREMPLILEGVSVLGAIIETHVLGVDEIAAVSDHLVYFVDLVLGKGIRIDTRNLVVGQGEAAFERQRLQGGADGQVLIRGILGVVFDKDGDAELKGNA